jgi:hypothetical protein
VTRCGRELARQRAEGIEDRGVRRAVEAQHGGSHRAVSFASAALLLLLLLLLRRRLLLLLLLLLPRRLLPWWRRWRKGLLVSFELW